MMLYPLTFQPLFKQRLWGGRNLESLYGKPLPPNQTIGESWEIADRPEGVSIIDQGPLSGKSLHWLMEKERGAVLGSSVSLTDRFPLLLKILDAEEKLSLQVHPPPALAASLKGEPKTEFWYIARALPHAELYAGLRKGVTRDEFERCLAEKRVASCFHRIPVQTGDAMFLPSGRVHAIGSGNVIFEVQQNSDTTYRVFDWDRLDPAGQQRELHVSESLACINFEDHEPALVRAQEAQAGEIWLRPLIRHSLFSITSMEAAAASPWKFDLNDRCHLLAILEGAVEVKGGAREITLKSGQFCLLPAALGKVALKFAAGAKLLSIQAGNGDP